ncbi:MAG: hypothetical protein M1833_006681 [Piccolia ochrophora]|nr:MAG: hypothetical protein M1833_006681 [Piccolia ochrophora]
MKPFSLSFAILLSRAIVSTAAESPPLPKAPLTGYGLGCCPPEVPGAPLRQLFEDALQRPNATGQASISPGFNLQDPRKPDNGKVPPTWYQNVAVTDVPIKDETARLSANRIISFDWPTEKEKIKVWDGWNVCVLELMQKLPSGTVTAGQGDDGSCSATLGDTCIKALQNDFDSAFNTAAPDAKDPCTDGPLPPVPAACREWVLGSSSTEQTAWPPGGGRNVLPLGNKTAASEPWSHVTYRARSSSDLYPYQEAASSIQPVILVKYTNEKAERSSSDLASATETRLVCAKADTFVGSSKVVDGVPSLAHKASLRSWSLITLAVSLGAAVLS